MCDNKFVTMLDVSVNILNQNLDFLWYLDVSLNRLDKDFVVPLDMNICEACL